MTAAVAAGVRVASAWPQRRADRPCRRPAGRPVPASRGSCRARPASARPGCASSPAAGAVRGAAPLAAALDALADAFGPQRPAAICRELDQDVRGGRPRRWASWRAGPRARCAARSPWSSARARARTDRAGRPDGRRRSRAMRWRPSPPSPAPPAARSTTLRWPEPSRTSLEVPEGGGMGSESPCPRPARGGTLACGQGLGEVARSVEVSYEAFDWGAARAVRSGGPSTGSNAGPTTAEPSTPPARGRRLGLPVRRWWSAAIRAARRPRWPPRRGTSRTAAGWAAI